MIIYVKFDVSIHGLQFKSEAELEALWARMTETILAMPELANRRLGGLDGDVEIEIDEWAGESDA